MAQIRVEATSQPPRGTVMILDSVTVWMWTDYRKESFLIFLEQVAKETSVSKGKARLELARKLNERSRHVQKRRKRGLGGTVARGGGGTITLPAAKGYANCSCIAGGTAVAGLCDYGCPMVFAYMLCFCLSAFAGTVAIVPRLIVYLRVSEERDKSLAIGLHTFMVSVIGWMLGPICFGKLIDSVCFQWEKSCSGGGACRLYDNDDFRLKFYGVQIAALSVALGFLFAGFVIARVTGKLKKNKDNEVGENMEANTAFIIAEDEGGKKQDRQREQGNS